MLESSEELNLVRRTMNMRVCWKRRAGSAIHPSHVNITGHTLRDDRVIDIEEQMQALQGNVNSQTPVLEFAPKVHRSKIPSFGLLHQHDARQDSRHRSRSDCKDQIQQSSAAIRVRLVTH
jgi:hypothetical protein